VKIRNDALDLFNRVGSGRTFILFSDKSSINPKRKDEISVIRKNKNYEDFITFNYVSNFYQNADFTRFGDYCRKVSQHFLSENGSSFSVEYLDDVINSFDFMKDILEFSFRGSNYTFLCDDSNDKLISLMSSRDIYSVNDVTYGSYMRDFMCVANSLNRIIKRNL
jgi:hypothetical protein